MGFDPKRSRREVGAFAVVAVLVCAIAQASESSSSPVTYSEHVAPILFENCASYHRPDQAAPFSLLSYADARKRGRMIEIVTESGYMPPWHPAPGHGEFVGELGLRADEIELLARWVDEGMPEGDPSKCPPVPTFASGWALGEPDLVVRMPKAYDVPADGPDIYRNFAVPLGLEEDRWLTAIEVRPSARSVLHHIVFALDATGEARELDGADGEPGYFGMQGGAETGRAGLGGWAVGGMPQELPLGLATHVAAGADLVLRSHFHPSGKPEQEQTVLGLHFTDEPPTRTMVGLQLPPVFGFAAGLDIAPGDADFAIEDSFTLPIDVLAVTVGGHAHYVCDEMQIVATDPRGEKRSLFFIDEWDFRWQNRYVYREPVELAAGTRIDARLLYDNSSANPDNPFDPPQRIGWGLESTDEMGSVTLLLVAKDESEVGKLQGAIRDHMRSSLRDPSARQSSLAAMRSRLRMLDRDRDGAVERDELTGRGRLSAWRADTNGDGKLDDDEIDAIGRDTLAATSPRERGPLLRDVNGWTLFPLDPDSSSVEVLIFTTVDCPIANGYAPEIARIADEFEVGDGKRPARVTLVHVDPAVTAARARDHAAEYGLDRTGIRIALDPDHAWVRRTGVTHTPEAAVLRDGEIVYRGRIDNLYGDLGKKRPAATKYELRDALEAACAGRDVDVARTDAVGCTIGDLR